MNIVRHYSDKKLREIARRQYGRRYRKLKGIRTCYCNGWWFPHRLGSEPVEEQIYGYFNSKAAHAFK